MKKTTPFPRILAAVDLSKPALAGLEAAKFLARRGRAKLELVHVTDLPAGPLAPGPGMPLVTTDYSWPWKDYHEWRRERLTKELAGFPAGRVKVRDLRGWPPAALVALARGKSADLLVLGTHGYEGLDRALFGSIAETVVRRSRVPVLVARTRKTPFRVARILAPWNGEAYANDALRLARDLARSLGARLEVLRVTASTAPESEILPGLRRRVKKVLGAGRWTVGLRRGDPRRAIIEAAKPERYDLVVLAAHRRPFSSDMILGSTAERVLRHSRVSVLAVPSEGKRRKEGQVYIF